MTLVGWLALLSLGAAVFFLQWQVSRLWKKVERLEQFVDAEVARIDANGRAVWKTLRENDVLERSP